MTTSVAVTDRKGLARVVPSPLLVLLLAAAVLLWNLWGYDLWAPDEPYFGEGAREMVVDGHWVVPYVNGAVTTDKPPLFFWLIALISLPFGGVSAGTARLPSLLAALGALILTLRLARRWWGEGTATLACVFLSTMVLFWRQARSAQIDSLLCFLVLVSLSALADFREGRARGRPAGLLFWGAAAAATLAKGPVGILIPLVVALLTLGFDRALGSWRRFAPLAGPALFFALTGAWVLVAVRSGEPYSVVDALRRHFVERAAYGMHHVQPPWYYLTTLPVGLLPWTGVVIGGLVLAWRERRDPQLRFLLIWGLAVVLMFSLSTEKRDLYVLPALPAFALLAAGFVDALARGGSDRRIPSRGWVTLSLGILGGLILAVGIALPFAAGRLKLAVDLTGPVRALAVALVPGGLAMLWQAARRRWAAAITATAVTLALVYLLVQSVVFPALDPVKSVRRFAVELRAATSTYRAAGKPVLTHGLRNVPRAISFYSGGVYLRELEHPGELARALARPAPVYAAVDRGTLDALPPAVRERTRIVAATSTSDQQILLVQTR